MINADKVGDDYYVRISAYTMSGIRLRHHFSEVTCFSRHEGFTEWIAEVDYSLVCVSWDWVRLSDGGIAQPRCRQVVTNVMLIDHYGFDQGIDLTEVALSRLVDQIDWKTVVARTCGQ